MHPLHHAGLDPQDLVRDTDPALLDGFDASMAFFVGNVPIPGSGDGRVVTCVHPWRSAQPDIHDALYFSRWDQSARDVLHQVLKVVFVVDFGMFVVSAIITVMRAARS